MSGCAASRKNSHKAVLLAATILCGILPNTLKAQSTLPAVPAPPVFSNVDENGVDVATGTFNFSLPLVSIGEGDGKLEFRVQTSGKSWRGHNFEGSVGCASGTDCLVRFDGDSEKFTNNNGAYISQQAEGAKLSLANGLYTYTKADGTIIVFSNIPLMGYRPTLIVTPQGANYDLTYDVKYASTPAGLMPVLSALATVTSSYGYQLRFLQVVPNGGGFPSLAKVTAINNAVDYCNPNHSGFENCPNMTQAWPSVSVVSTAPTGGSAPLITSATNALGAVTSFTTVASGPAAGQLATVKRPGSTANALAVAYDTVGNVASVTLENLVFGYNYAVSNGIATMTRTNPNGSTKVYTTTLSVGRPSSIKDESNRTISYTYDTFGHVTRVTMPEGNYTNYTYDTRGNVTLVRQVAKAGSGFADIVTSASYDATCTNNFTCNQPNTTTDAKGFITNYSYDPATGDLLTVQAPAAAAGGARPTTNYGYTTLQTYVKNSAGAVVASGDPIKKLTSTSVCQTTASCAGTADETKITINYGAQVAGNANNLNVVSVTQASGNNALSSTTSYGYDMIGNQITVDGPLAGTVDTTRARYDVIRRPVGQVGPDPDGAGPRLPIAQRTTYNTDSQVTQIEVGTVTDQSDSAWSAFSSQQQTSTTYDANARPVKQEIKSGGTTYAVTQTSYDTLGRVDCTAQRMDPAQWASQTVVCTPQTSGADGPDRVSKNFYDNAGNVTIVQTAVGTSAVSDEVTATYSANNQKLSVKDGENNLTIYVYDGHDRLIQTRYPVETQGANASSTSDYEGLSYDANGNVTQRRLRDGQLIGYAWDNLNRLDYKDLPGAEADVDYAYDLLGRTTNIVDTAGNYLGFAYDALGRATAQSSPLGVYGMGYDAAGRRTSLAHPDNYYVNYDYDVTGNVTAIRENGATSGVGVLASYAYDSLGRRTSLTRGNGTVTGFAYDPVSRLSAFAQDLAGTANDLTLNAITYSPASQIKTQTGSNDAYAWNSHYNITRAYGVNGLNQLTSAGATALGYDGRGNLTSSGSNSYGYSNENLLKTGPNGVTLGYDPALRLYETTGAGVTMRFGYDGQDLIAEYNASNSLLRRYVHGPGSDEPLVWYEGVGTADRRWLHADERGSVIALTDASGNALAINRYDEYGIPAATNIGRFGYTGQTWLPEIGMNYYKARIYSPTLGRFMQTDPIGYGDGMNLYNYVGSDPVNGRDPTGMWVVNGYPNGAPNCVGGSCLGPGAGIGAAGNFGFDLSGSGPGAGMGPGFITAVWSAADDDAEKNNVKAKSRNKAKETPGKAGWFRSKMCGLGVATAGAGIGYGTAKVVKAGVQAYALSRSVIGAEVGASAGSVGGPIGAGVGAAVGFVGMYFAGEYVTDKICGSDE